MQTIGERLEEARERLGISLREASEATKIRTDFLASLEKNVMEIDLPEIYRRGFLKSYARYLEMDVDKLMADYDVANAPAAPRTSRREGGTTERGGFFGRMELQHEHRRRNRREAIAGTSDGEDSEESAETAAPGEPPPPNRPRAGAGKTRVGGTGLFRTLRDGLANLLTRENGLYVKIGLLIGGGIVLIILVIMLLGVIFRDASPAPGTSGTATPQQQTSSGVRPTDGTTTPASTEAITLFAQGGTVNLVVVQLADNQTLYNGRLADGESVSLDKQGRVRLRFDAGENLVIQLPDGRRVRPQTEGVGRTTVP